MAEVYPPFVSGRIPGRRAKLPCFIVSKKSTTNTRAATWQSSRQARLYTQTGADQVAATASCASSKVKKLAAPRLEAMPEWQQRSGFNHTCKLELSRQVKKTGQEKMVAYF
jgi:hypothetical protein